MDKMKMQAKPMDLVLAKVMEICPCAVQNGKVDFDRLRMELANVVDDTISESYDFTWVGKRKAIVEANKPINKTLRPAMDESKNWETTENLYIEGDNLEVLKLLQESYLNKVKMIYIDPPYNTGKDFVYRDNFTQKKAEYELELGTEDEEGNKLFRNTETNGRFHSDWCSMMYPRLKLARDFLTDDGVIFISIDDNEVANLRKICDEVFGEDNFVGDLIRKTKSMTGDEGSGVNIQHENLLCFAKSKMNLFLNGEEKEYSGYSNPDKDSKGDWISGDPSAKSGGETTYFSIKNPFTNKEDYPPKGRFWAFSKDSLDKYISSGKIKFKETYSENERGFIFKRYKSELKSNFNPVSTLFFTDNVFMNSVGTKEILEIFDSSCFDSPKPSMFVKNFIKYSTAPNDIILDFFSGSSTTAHAVMQLNAEDGGNRKFIMVQLPEETDKDSEAFKAGYKNICEIGKERIRRAGEKILSSLRAEGEAIQSKNDSILKLDCHVADAPRNDDIKLDIGFRVLKLDESNMKDVYYNPSTLTQANLLDSVDNIKNDRKPLDLLFGVMVDWGLDLSMPIKEQKIGNNTVYVVDSRETEGIDLITCFDENIDENCFTQIANMKPTRAVFRDKSFARDDAKINAFEIFKAIAPDSQIKVI